jgi:hypothetical protein
MTANGCKPTNQQQPPTLGMTMTAEKRMLYGSMTHRNPADEIYINARERDRRRAAGGQDAE